jgi:poly-gamma-glutamate capsule biosynthesis protein CapA/YwtB (metallophosphatase superfamily)
MRRLGFLAVILCVLLSGCGDTIRKYVPSVKTPLPAAVPEASTPVASAGPVMPAPAFTPLPTPKPEPVKVSIMAVGDIMFHHLQIVSSYDKKEMQYDFSHCFRYVKDIISSADLALGNFESTLSGTPYTKSGESVFSSPDALADALKDAGFDALCTANNHQNDRGAMGLTRTLDVLSGKGIACFGTRRSADEKPYVILDVKGIKVGIAAYTFCTRPGGTGVALNGRRLSEDVQDLVNVFSYATLDRDIDAAGETARQMRSDGAEIVLFYMHWGTEFTRTPDRYQIKLAQGLADAGVDVVLGCHPHWLQPFDVLNGANGRKTYAIYSLGNFISGERKASTARFKYTEDSVILNVNVIRQPGCAARISSVEYLPVWTFIYSQNGSSLNTVIPLEKAIAFPKSYCIDMQNGLNRAKTSLGDTQKLMAEAVKKGYISPMEAD